MEFHWLNKQNNDNLIVFFCGWSFDYKPFENLSCGNYDVIAIYDYNHIDDADKIKNEISLNYKTKTLITWSMGVYVAYELKNTLPVFDKKIAINGTPHPIDDNFGIPEKTFELTLKYVDTGLQGKFQKNLFKRNDDFKKYITAPVKRNIENQKSELQALNDYINSNKIQYKKFYDCAIISDTDKIIPSRNQINCWEEYNTPYKIIDNGHFPFYSYENWEEIINAAKY